MKRDSSDDTNGDAKRVKLANEQQGEQGEQSETARDVLSFFDEHVWHETIGTGTIYLPEYTQDRFMNIMGGCEDFTYPIRSLVAEYTAKLRDVDAQEPDTYKGIVDEALTKLADLFKTKCVSYLKSIKIHAEPTAKQFQEIADRFEILEFDGKRVSFTT